MIAPKQDTWQQAGWLPAVAVFLSAIVLLLLLLHTKAKWGRITSFIVPHGLEGCDTAHEADGCQQWLYSIVAQQERCNWI
jgi:hypothetical protein